MLRPTAETKSLVSLDDWLVSRARFFENTGDLLAAVDYWRRVLRILRRSRKASDTELAQVHFELGRLHTQLRNRIKSIYHLKSCIRLSSDQPRYYEAFGRAFLSSGHWRIAKNQFYKAVILDPTNDAYWRQYAWALLRLARFEEAVQAAQKAVALMPAQEKNFYILSQVLCETHQWNDLSHSFSSWKAHHPHSSLLASSQKFAERRFRSTLQGAVLSFLKSRIVLDGQPFHLGHLTRAEKIWSAFCQREKRAQRKRPNSRIVKIWSAAVALSTLEKGMETSLEEVASHFEIEIHELQAASRLLRTRGHLVH